MAAAFGRVALQFKAQQLRHKKLAAGCVLSHAVTPPKDLAGLVVPPFENVEFRQFECCGSDARRRDWMERVVCESCLPSSFRICARSALR